MGKLLFEFSKNENNTSILLYQISMINKHISGITFLYEAELIFLHAFKLFQILRCISNDSIKHQSFVYTQLNDQTVLFLTIQFSISHFFALI